MDLASKTVLITGGARGIGLELAKMCAADRATVLLIDVSAEHLKRAVDTLQQAGADVRGFVHDVTDRGACYELQRRISVELGPVDVLINNAGVVHHGDFLEGDDEAWRHTVDVNLHGVMWMMRAFMPAMIARREGHVVNVASVLGLASAGGAAVYCATKHALVGLTEAVRFELLERGCSGVSLTLACPGFTETGMFQGVKTPLLFRPAATRDTAMAIYRAVRRRARILIYPHRFRLLAQIHALTPHWLWKLMTRLLGVHRAMDSHRATDREGGGR